jgi:predicted RNase H-like HicB family nuclease
MMVSDEGEGVVMRYAVIVEKGDSSFGAYAPDLPGCAAVTETIEEVLRLI